jgi:hypothetical protein
MLLTFPQWLTTGRNSCPLCRGQGVDEKASPTLQVTNPDTDVADALMEDVA